MNPFWSDVFSALYDFRNIIKEEIQLTPIWYNDLFKLGGNAVYILQWYEKGLTYIADFLNENFEFYSLEHLNNRFDLNMDFLTYTSVIRQLKILTCNEQLFCTQRPIIPKYLNLILSTPRGCKKIYNAFISVFENKPKLEIKSSFLKKNSFH